MQLLRYKRISTNILNYTEYKIRALHRLLCVKFVSKGGVWLDQSTGPPVLEYPSALITRRMNRRAITIVHGRRMESYVNRAETFSFEAAGARQLARADTRRSS